MSNPSFINWPLPQTATKALQHSEEARLKKRLDDLENDLKSLHARVARKRRPSKYSTVQLKYQQFNDPKKDASTKIKGSKPESKKKTCTSWEEAVPQHLKNDCLFFLHNISKNIAKGTQAIHRIASLTEISSLSGRGDCLNHLENVCHRLSGSFVNNKYVNPRLKTKYETSEYNKQVKKLQFSECLSEAPTTPPTKDNPSDMKLLKEELENGLVDQKILKEKIESLKKKFRDERSKREIAEKATASYKRRLAALEGKKMKHKNSEDVHALKKENMPSQKENISFAETELKAEQEKISNAEKKIKELLNALEESRKEISIIEDSRRVALAMADQFRGRICQHDPQELEKLRAEKAALEEEVKQLQFSPEIVFVEKLVEKTEQELLEKMKQCNSFMARSSLNDPEVQEVIERHKAAYSQLEMEMNHKEAELKNQCALYEKAMVEAKVADEKYKDLSEKYNQTVSNLHEKQLAEKKFRIEKSLFESEVKNLKKRLEDFTKANSDLEKEIVHLKENIQLKEEEIEKHKTLYKESKELNALLDEKYNELKDVASERDQTIESLRLELERDKDIIKIKEKMLQDQADTIKCLRTVSDNTKKNLDDERIQKRKLKDEIDRLQLSRETLHSKITLLEQRLKENEESQLSLKKSNESLKLQEEQIQNSLKVASQHEVLLNKLTQMCHEKDQAIQTARFATEKLVQAINEYELKLSAQKKIQNMLETTLREKEFQLDVANQQINELNEDLWKSSKASEQIRSELQTKLRKACEVCTDVLDITFEMEL